MVLTALQGAGWPKASGPYTGRPGTRARQGCEKTRQGIAEVSPLWNLLRMRRPRTTTVVLLRRVSLPSQTYPALSLWCAVALVAGAVLLAGLPIRSCTTGQTGDHASLRMVRQTRCRASSPTLLLGHLRRPAPPG